MAFTVEDFRDLLQVLEQHPEWRAQLRRHVLDAELLELPALVRLLAEAQVRTEQRLDRLTEQVAALAEAQTRTEQRLGQLADRVDRLAEQVAALTTQAQDLVSDVGSLKGDMFELRVRTRAASYFGHLARRLRVLDNTFLADLLDDAVDEGRLTLKERAEVLWADAVLSGRRREDQAEVYLVVEASVGVGLSDVLRATERAALLAKLGRPVMPVVAGQFSSPEADNYARSSGVWQVLAGRRVPPEAS
jgi:cell division protein FtsB